MNGITYLSKRATDIFNKLIEGLDTDHNDGSKTSKRFDKHNYWPQCDGGFMAVHVEFYCRMGGGYPVYTIAHYYKQNGDLMSDPEMLFVVVHGQVAPMTFTQHNLGIYQRALYPEGDGPEWKVHPDAQADMAAFVEDWFENIVHQQDIEV